MGITYDELEFALGAVLKSFLVPLFIDGIFGKSEDKVEELIEFLFKGSVVLVRFVYPESPLPVFHESILPVVSNPVFTFLEFISILPLLNSLFITWFPFLIGANPI